MHRIAVLFTLFLSWLALAPDAHAEASRVRLAKQPGLTYLPFAVVEHQRLVEKHARTAGLGEVAVEWRTFSGGNVMNDALLSDNLDYAATGIPAFLTLWDKARGPLELKAVAGYGSAPLFLLTTNPNVKSIRDFGPQDRIAVPAVRASLQAIVLQIAAEKAFGQGNHGRLDNLTVSRGHPDAMAAMVSGKGEINSHFSAPPFQYMALKTPGVRVVMTISDVFNGPVSNGLLYTTVRFRNENPKLHAAVLAAFREAIEIINRDRRAAAESYLAVVKDKNTVESILGYLGEKGVEYTLTPKNVHTLADFMHRIGSIRNRPADWKTLFFPEAHDAPGS